MISVRLPCRPVEGCALRAQGVVRSTELARDDMELRWRWLRGESVVPNCAYENCDFAYDYDPVSVSRRGHALLCVACLKQQQATGLPHREALTFCSARCFVAAWPDHKRRHCAKALNSAASSSEEAAGSKRLRANSEGATSDDSMGPLGRHAVAGQWPQNGSRDEHSFEAWELVAEGSPELVASAEDVGRRLRVECYVFSRSRGDEVGARGVVVTEPVLARPGPAPERRFYGDLEDFEGRIRIASYNVLAEIYATSNMYPYCPRWALDWQYRCRRVVDEIAEAEADVICLQEAQRDHYERDLEPALEQRGYEGTFTQKSRASMGAAGKVDGCALFWKRDKFRLAEQRVVTFNDLARSEAAALALADRDEHAFLLRLVKDNVAQIAVLESYEHRGPRRLCVANTHLYSHKDFSDTKLWQALHLTRELDRFLHSRPHRDHLPLVLAGDFNSAPQSAVHDFLLHAHVDPSHHDLRPDAPPGSRRPSNVLPPDPRDISHRLNLASAYNTLLGAEPPYTNFTKHFRGTLDYILYDPTALRCLAVAEIYDKDEITNAGDALPNAQFPSDHVMLIADFRLL